ncbi:MAG: hypothetical protein IJJ01_03030 [Firmicutes bacterium]|nr:hypothetical protein [Bacillota bacterium]
MDRIRRKCLQVGLIVAFAVFLIAFAKPLPLPDIAPQLTAGAAKLPMVKWQETEAEVTEQDPEIVTVTDPAPEEAAPIGSTGETPAAGEAPEEPAPAAGEEDYWEAQPDYDELDLLYRTVQAEGYTLGYEGMRLITDAILNLAEHQGVSVTDCILNPGQFTVISTGAIWKEPVYQDTIDAVLTEVRGPRVDYEIKYFRTNHFHGFGTPCFEFGNVYFSS